MTRISVYFDENSLNQTKFHCCCGESRQTRDLEYFCERIRVVVLLDVIYSKQCPKSKTERCWRAQKVFCRWNNERFCPIFETKISRTTWCRVAFLFAKLLMNRIRKNDNLRHRWKLNKCQPRCLIHIWKCSLGLASPKMINMCPPRTLP